MNYLTPPRWPLKSERLFWNFVLPAGQKAAGVLTPSPQSFYLVPRGFLQFFSAWRHFSGPTCTLGGLSWARICGNGLTLIFISPVAIYQPLSPISPVVFPFFLLGASSTGQLFWLILRSLPPSTQSPPCALKAPPTNFLAFHDPLRNSPLNQNPCAPQEIRQSCLL